MKTYKFPNRKNPITSDSWDWDFAGVKYIDGVSQPGFMADITFYTSEGKKKGVCVVDATTRPSSPMTEETLIDWIATNMIKYEI